MSTISMLPDTLNARLYAGDGVTVRAFLMQDASRADGGDPWADAGDYTYTAQIRASASPTATLILDVTVDDAGLSEDPPYIELVLTGDDVADLGAATRYWDLQATPESGEPVTLWRGWVRTTLDVTQVTP